MNIRMAKSRFLLVRSSLSASSFYHRGPITKSNPPYVQCQASRASSLLAFKSAHLTIGPKYVLYEPLEDAERMEYNRVGAYHPVAIGDRFCNR